MDSLQAWFDELYREHAPQMLRVATRILHNRTTAEDVVQDTFIILLSKQEYVRNHFDNPAGWLYVTLRNQIGNVIQRESRRNHIPLDDSRCESLEAQEFTESLADSLPSGLSESEREILIMFYEYAWTYEEIAAKLNHSVLACRTRLCRAKAHYKKLILRNETCNVLSASSNIKSEEV